MHLCIQAVRRVGSDCRQRSWVVLQCRCKTFVSRGYLQCSQAECREPSVCLFQGEIGDRSCLLGMLLVMRSQEMLPSSSVSLLLPLVYSILLPLCIPAFPFSPFPFPLPYSCPVVLYTLLHSPLLMSTLNQPLCLSDLILNSKLFSTISSLTHLPFVVVLFSSFILLIPTLYFQASASLSVISGVSVPACMLVHV